VKIWGVEAAYAIICFKTANIKYTANLFCELEAISLYFIDSGSGVLKFVNLITIEKI
jgi:hypothetical protein